MLDHIDQLGYTDYTDMADQQGLTTPTPPQENVMTSNPPISTERCEAIGRAARAVVRLAIDHEATLPAHRQNQIVNDVSLFTDRESWDAVAALEHMVFVRGLVSAEQMDTERRAAAVAVLMGEEIGHDLRRR